MGTARSAGSARTADNTRKIYVAGSHIETGISCVSQQELGVCVLCHRKVCRTLSMIKSRSVQTKEGEEEKVREKANVGQYPETRRLNKGTVDQEGAQYARLGPVLKIKMRMWRRVHWSRATWQITLPRRILIFGMYCNRCQAPSSGTVQCRSPCLHIY